MRDVPNSSFMQDGKSSGDEDECEHHVFLVKPEINKILKEDETGIG